MKGSPRHIAFTLLLTCVSGLLATQVASADTTVSTDPVGYNVFSLPVGNSVRVNTFVQAKSFQGTMASVTSASNSVITVTGSGTILSSGTYNQTSAEPSYFVEVLSSGSGQGLIADVISNTATTITVAGNLASYGAGNGTSFCVRPHTTLSSLFPATSALTANVDSIKLFYPNNTSRSFIFVGSGSGWADSGTFADSGSEVVYPGQGFIITVGGARTVTVMGSVKAGPTQVPVYANAVNVVGSFNCNIGGTQILGDLNLPASFAKNVDTAKLLNDGTLAATTAYLSDGSQMIDGGTFTPSNSVAVAPSSGLIISVGQTKNLVLPSFYTSGQ